MIDKDGKQLIAPNYHYLNDFHNGYSAGFSFTDDKMGLLDKSGKILLEPVYSFVFAHKDGLVYLTKNEFKGLADKYGNIIVEPIYNKMSQIQNGLLMVERNKKFGYMNKKGDIVIPLIYDEALDFSEGLAPVLKGGFWAVIDTIGKKIIDSTFIGVMSGFKNGYAAYGKRDFSSGAHYTTDLWGIIDRKGNKVVPNKYYSVGIPYKGFLSVVKEGKSFLIDMNGKIISELKHDEVPVQIGN